jgi:hypothetical protein
LHKIIKVQGHIQACC